MNHRRGEGDAFPNCLSSNNVCSISCSTVVDSTQLWQPQPNVTCQRFSIPTLFPSSRPFPELNSDSQQVSSKQGIKTGILRGEPTWSQLEAASRQLGPCGPAVVGPSDGSIALLQRLVQVAFWLTVGS